MQLGGLFIFFSVCIHPAGGGGTQPEGRNKRKTKEMPGGRKRSVARERLRLPDFSPSGRPPREGGKRSRPDSRCVGAGSEVAIGSWLLLEF